MNRPSTTDWHRTTNQFNMFVKWLKLVEISEVWVNTYPNSSGETQGSYYLINVKIIIWRQKCAVTVSYNTK